MSGQCDRKAFTCPRQCLWALSLFVIVASTLCASLMAFAYHPAPSRDSCWVVPSWTPGYFKEDERNWYKGLEGTDSRLAWEDDSDFEMLYTLHVAAVVVSGIGLLWSIRKLQEVVAWKGTFQGCDVALLCYFVAGFIVNLITQVCFVHNRCNDHNIHYLLPDDAIPLEVRVLPSLSEGWIDISTFPAKLAKALYLTMTLVGGFLTNTILECVLLRTVHKMENASGLHSYMKRTKLFNYVLLVATAIALPIAFWIFMHMMDEGVGAVGGTDAGETLTLLFNTGAAMFVAFHILISLVVMVASVTPAKGLPQLRLSNCKVPICTCIIILSTLCCYGNMVTMLGNAYILLPADSIINNVCMVILYFVGNPKEDANVPSDEQIFCEDSKCINDHPSEQGASSDVIGKRRPSTHSIHSAISAIEEAWVAIASFGSQNNYKAFKGEDQHGIPSVSTMFISRDVQVSSNSEEYRPSTPVVLEPSTPNRVTGPLTPMSITGDSQLHSTPVVLAPSTPTRVSGPPTPMSITGDSRLHASAQGEHVLPPV